MLVSAHMMPFEGESGKVGVNSKSLGPFVAVLNLQKYKDEIFNIDY